MVEFKFHCAMPMFVARQWIRHRTASVNEYSGRYSLMPLLYYMPEREQFALQSAQNQQGRDAVASDVVYVEAVERWRGMREAASDGYTWMVGEDVAREIARIDLPLSTYTQWYWKIDLHNLLHFLSLRADPHAQWEIRVFAEIIAGMVKRVAPLSYEAWVDYDLVGQPMSRGELTVLSQLLDSGEDGITARAGASYSADEMKDAGLSGREIRELVTKLQAPTRPDFELDLSKMKAAEEIAKTMSEAVPDSPE
jgi:thymidylate synthase (FAD)